VQFYLEDLMGSPVDLVTNKALRPQLRPYIEKELIHVWANSEHKAGARLAHVCG